MTPALLKLMRSSLPHLVALIVILACLRLAWWQLDRAEEKDMLLNQWRDAPALETARLHDDAAPAFARIEGLGTFDTRRHVLLDNQIRNNHPGVHVFSLFQPLDGGPPLMVNRGWQPWQRRSGEWPQFDTPVDPVTITGRLSPPPRVGFQIGEAQTPDPDTWPNLTTYFDIERLRDVFGPDLYSQVLLLEPEHALHLTGDPWQMVVMGPERHRGYAFQWFSIALAVFLIWAYLTFRQIRRQ
ncbi:MAG: SURF1 family protein [Wenzhouxiangella sp.]|nr:MAG: SURF1 family protein [Wenzhouxiangella sp.]